MPIVRSHNCGIFFSFVCVSCFPDSRVVRDAMCVSCVWRCTQQCSEHLFPLTPETFSHDTAQAVEPATFFHRAWSRLLINPHTFTQYTWTHGSAVSVCVSSKHTVRPQLLVPLCPSHSPHLTSESLHCSKYLSRTQYEPLLWPNPRVHAWWISGCLEL